MNRIKTSIDRICYYSRKVNDYSARRFDFMRRFGTTVQPPTNRAERLLRYKAAIYRRIQAEGSAAIC
ncbi:hypothetical protein [Paenibacillus sp. OAS669]|uniref:hypothetical protein n=1 Tax=Paenibacillus sp. OAS669 TaxID=2663821 RepID=UPI00178AE7A1|nr:hypothetical protein [Paenibacillus sp. OAS669]MBE1443903.1 hypothetical protein [Paenibacillus sp. OAS669]